MRIKVIQTLIGILFFSAALESFAVPITGSIGMGGNFIPVDSSWAATGTAAATGVDFNPNLFIVNSTSGDFAGSSFLGGITDFQFDPVLGINDGFGGVTAVSSIANFWTLDAFSFNLMSVTRGFTNDPNTFLVLNGTGVISAAGFDDTSGTWSFTGDTTNAGTFTWSAGSAAVTEPGLPALLGLGICLIGLAGRIRSRA